MIEAAFVAIGLAAIGFGYRLLRGPSLADRMMALDGLLIVGVSAIALPRHADGRRRLHAGGGRRDARRVHRHRGGGPLHRRAGPVIAEAIALLGAVLTLLSAAGVVRFSDVFERSHALTKAATLGLVLVLAGAAIALDHPNDVTNLVLAGILQVITMPVGANLMNGAVYRAVGIPHRVDTVDELAEAEVEPGER